METQGAKMEPQGHPKGQSAKETPQGPAKNAARGTKLEPKGRPKYYTDTTMYYKEQQRRHRCNTAAPSPAPIAKIMTHA